MKIAKWFYLGVLFLMGIEVLWGSQPKQGTLQSRSKIQFTDDSTYMGDALTATEIDIIQQAINNIRNGPPASISYRDSTGNIVTESCTHIADELQKMLDRRVIQAETQSSAYAATVPDNVPGFGSDEMNVNRNFLAFIRANPNLRLKYLQETLVHEHRHVLQSSAGTLDGEEWEAFAAEHAYKDCLVAQGQMDTTDSEYKFCLQQYIIHLNNYLAGQSAERVRDYRRIIIHGFTYYIEIDPSDTGSDYIISFSPGDTSMYRYDLSPTRVSDMRIYEDYFLLPPGRDLALICGGEPASGTARILTLDLHDGEVNAPYITLDFGPPAYPPMFFYSMTYSAQTDLYYVLDTLNQKILVMADINEDLIPDTITSTYADALWPGFEPLANMRGVDFSTHRDLGPGLVVNHVDAHLPECARPYTAYWFLPDANEDSEADACNLVYRYEFLAFPPEIQVPLPVGGDLTVQLFATWHDDIEVWTTDALGQNLYELLGTTYMTGGVDAQCALNQPLVVGWFVIPFDANTNQRPALPTEVRSAAPVECPPGGAPENEPCPNEPDNFNGGCNSSPPIFSVAECNQTICGTAWVDAYGRDTDWYQKVFTEPAHITWSVVAEFAVDAYVIDGTLGCDYYTVLAYGAALSSDTVRLSCSVCPGIYWFLVSPNGWWDLPCADYVAWLTCEPSEPAVPIDVTVCYNADTGNVELHWTDTGTSYYFIYRSTTSPYDGFAFLGAVPAGVGFFADYACANTTAFYYVTGSCDAP